MPEQTLDDKLREERAKLEDFSRETEEMLRELGEKSRKEFKVNLNRLLTDDVAQFKRTVVQSLAADGLNLLSPAITDFATSIGGETGGALIDGPIKALLGSFLSKGKFDGRDAIRRLSGNKGFRNSLGQIGSDLLGVLKKAGRNG